MSFATKAASIAFAAFAAFTVATPALAAPASVVTTEVVYSDLNLNSKAGIETLNRRIEAATQQVCERDWDRAERRASNFTDIQSCLVETRRDIAEQISQNRELATAPVFGDTMVGDISR